MFCISEIRGHLVTHPRPRTTASGRAYLELRLMRPSLQRHDGDGGFIAEPALDIRVQCRGDVQKQAAGFLAGDRVRIGCGPEVQLELLTNRLIVRLNATSIALAPEEPLDDEPTDTDSGAAPIECPGTAAVLFLAAPRELVAAA